MIDLDETRAVIVTGAGEKAFVAGADIAAMSTMTVKEGREFGKFGNDIFRRLETLPDPHHCGCQWICPWRRQRAGHEL